MYLLFPPCFTWVIFPKLPHPIAGHYSYLNIRKPTHLHTSLNSTLCAVLECISENLGTVRVLSVTSKFCPVATGGIAAKISRPFPSQLPTPLNDTEKDTMHRPEHKQGSSVLWAWQFIHILLLMDSRLYQMTQNLATGNTANDLHL